jgi:hypothetical protein
MLTYPRKIKWNTWAVILIEDWDGKAHQNQKKIAQTKSETNALTIQKINSIKRKQYSNPYGPMEFSYGGQRPTPTLKSSSVLIQDSLIYSDHTLVHKQPQDPWKCTNERSAEWNKKVDWQIPKKIRKPHKYTSNEPSR